MQHVKSIPLAHIPNIYKKSFIHDVYPQNIFQALDMSRGFSIGSILAYPVYAYYWIQGLSAVPGILTAVLAYNNSEHGDQFNNILSFMLSDPYAISVYQYRYEVAFFSLMFLVINSEIRARHERTKWKPIMEEYRDLDRQFDHLNELISASANLHAAKFQERFVGDLRSIATSTSHIMSGYTGGRNCHVSIKTLGDDGIVETASRSQNEGAVTRANIDQELENFPYTDNKAFVQIVKDPKCSCFISNHLLLRKLFLLYYNAHKRWWMSYSATSVVPITTERNPQRITLETTYGFLCVDNHAGGFDREVCRHLLEHVASRCVDVMLRLSQR